MGLEEIGTALKTKNTQEWLASVGIGIALLIGKAFINFKNFVAMAKNFNNL